MKKMTVYAATVTHSKYGEKIMKLYSNPTDATKHIMKQYMEEMSKLFERQAFGEGRIKRYSDKECWYEWVDDPKKETGFDIKEKFWVKCMDVD